MRQVLKRRYAELTVAVPKFELTLAAALRDTFKRGYGRGDLKADILAGLVVGVVALPLSMALAIASGVPPQHGLYTAIVGGTVTALAGGSRTQVSGPTATFVILAPISARFGLSGLALASLMAGMILVILGAARMGQLIQFIPHPVTTGFTAGIAIVIATLQVKDFLGISISQMPQHYFARVAALVDAAPTAQWSDALIGLLTLTTLLLWPKITRRIPAPLIALSLAAVLAAILSRLVPGFEVATIGTRFSYVRDGVHHSGIPPLPPLPVLPWNLAGPDGVSVGLSFETVRQLLPSAFAIAMLGAIESLLSAVVADGMARTKHDPNGELLGQGLANIVSPFFGGFASTGAIARTATNIRAGARSPLASVTHALFILFSVLLLAPLVAYLPMAALAALLLLVAWNMSEVRHFLHILRIAPMSDVLVLLTCFSLTVIFDMVVSVTVGVALAALLFMRRMAATSSATGAEAPHDLPAKLPPGVAHYEIAGPLFFGATENAVSALHHIASDIKVLMLDLHPVPVMDVTGLVAFESAIARLREDDTHIVIYGLCEQPAKLLDDAKTLRAPAISVCGTFAEALEVARKNLELHALA